MAEINDLNITDASNTARFPENQAPSTVNNGMRALEGLVARWHENINASIATTGSANAYVLAAKGTQTLFDGLEISFDANFVNTGAATLNVDTTGAKNILKHNDVALAAGDIEQNQKVTVIYDGASWQMQSQLGVSVSPASSTDNALARYNGTIGQIQNSGWTLDDSNVLLGNELKLQGPQIMDYSETLKADGASASGNLAFSFADGNFHTATISGGAATLSFTNPPTSGLVGSMTLELTNGGSQTLTWTAVDWAGGTAPTLTSSGVDVLTFYTHDGGTTIHGMLASLDTS